MLNEVRLGFFPNGFSERKLLLWYLSSKELPALCQRGRACGAGYVAADTAAGSKRTHCSAMEKRCNAQLLLTHSSFYVDECYDLGRTVFWVILVIGTNWEVQVFFICWVLYFFVGTWAESYREG